MNLIAESLMSWYCSVEFQSWAIETYVKAMRSSMFTGFLTLSGFLLSAKTFLVVQLKKEMYDQKFYQEYYINRLKRGKIDINADTFKSAESIYLPLRNLSRLLMVAIISSLFASFCQITFGLFETFWSVVLCYFVAIFALCSVGCVLALMLWNLRIWFNNMDSHSRIEIVKEFESIEKRNKEQSDRIIRQREEERSKLNQ